MTTYKLVLALIKAGRIEGLQEKVDVYYAVGKLTKRQYTELTKKIKNAVA